jgi:hypothetical protein
MWKLWKRPTLATLLTGYALTLLAFLFFGRYFQGNYLGYILAVATPAIFLTTEAKVPARRRARTRRTQQLARVAVAPVLVATGAAEGPASTSEVSEALEPMPAPTGALD